MWPGAHILRDCENEARSLKLAPRTESGQAVYAAKDSNARRLEREKK